MSSKYSILLAALLAGCGGAGTESVIREAQAASAPVVVMDTTYTFTFILRPDPSGIWYIQNDVDHISSGVNSVYYDGVRGQLIVVFDRSYTHAKSVQITPDDDFTKNGVRAGCGLGLGSTNCTITVKDQEIDPRNILTYVPAGAGNFWVTVTMVNRS